MIAQAEDPERLPLSCGRPSAADHLLVVPQAVQRISFSVGKQDGKIASEVCTVQVWVTKEEDRLSDLIVMAAKESGLSPWGYSAFVTPTPIPDGLLVFDHYATRSRIDDVRRSGSLARSRNPGIY